MPSYKNTSDQVFQDGDVMVAPNEVIETQEQFRIDQLEGLYRWQFTKVSDQAEKSNEGELKERGAGDIRELRDGDHVKLDEEGNQAEKVGKDTTPTEKPESKKTDK